MQATQEPQPATAQKMGVQPNLGDLHFDEPPVIDFQTFFEGQENPNWELECKKVAYSFHKFGICVVRDPRVNHEDND